MSKKSTYLFFKSVIIIIIIIIILFKFNIFEKEETFKIKYPEKIDKIFVSDMYGNNIILKKETNQWTVNNLYNVREDVIKRICADIKKIEIKHPVSKKALPTVTKEMSSTAVKFTFYYGNKILKSFYVGGPTIDYLGTYMKNEKSKHIYVTHIPEHNGYLTPRFNISLNQVHLNEWRSRKIINAQKEQIEYCMIDSIIFNDKKLFKIITEIECEAFITNKYEKDFIEILKNTKPEKKIYIKYKNHIQKETKIELYKRYITNKSDEKILDQERMLGIIDDDIFIMQKYNLKKILKESNL